MMFERFVWWIRSEGFFLYANLREKYKSPKIQFIIFILFMNLIIYLFSNWK